MKKTWLMVLCLLVPGSAAAQTQLPDLSAAAEGASVIMIILGIASFVILVIWSVLWFMVPFHIAAMRRALDKMARDNR